MNEHQRNAYIEAWLVEARPLLVSWLTTNGLCDLETAEDCVQAVLDKAPPKFHWRPIPAEEQKGTFISFLRTCGRNEAVTRIRRRKTRTEHEERYGRLAWTDRSERQRSPIQEILDRESLGPGTHYAKVKVRRLVAHAVPVGSFNYLIICDLLEGQSIDSIARRHGKTYGTVRVALERTRKAIRKSPVAGLIREALSECNLT